MKKGGSDVPWKMIFFLVVLAFVVFFAGFNITNVSDISFGFYSVEQVPIFISLFIAFIIGALVMLPFVARKRSGRSTRIEKKKAPDDSQSYAVEEIPDIPVLDESDSPRNKSKKK